jgi:hypothetical protein
VGADLPRTTGLPLMRAAPAVALVVRLRTNTPLARLPLVADRRESTRNCEFLSILGSRSGAGGSWTVVHSGQNCEAFPMAGNLAQAAVLEEVPMASDSN